MALVGHDRHRRGFDDGTCEDERKTLTDTDGAHIAPPPALDRLRLDCRCVGAPGGRHECHAGEQLRASRHGWEVHSQASDESGESRVHPSGRVFLSRFTANNNYW